jgi:hypothetical protein
LRRRHRAAASAATLTWPALIALAGSVCFALLMIVTRMLRDTHDSVLMSSQMSGTLRSARSRRRSPG